MTHAPRISKRPLRLPTASRKPAEVFALLGALSLAGSCVTTGTYQAKQAELDRANGQLAASAQREEQAASTAAKLRAQIAELEQRLNDAAQALTRATGERDQLRRELDGNVALIAELQGKLRRLGQDVDKLVGQRGELAAALAATRARLDELRRQTEAAEAQAATYRSLVHKLHAMIDSVALQVLVRDGRMLIRMPTDVLFDSGRILVKPEAREGLGSVAEALREISNRKFRVDGHTDDVPIHNAHFASNWELSTGRAIAVAHILVDRGLPAAVVSVGGHADLDPVFPNDSDQHRSRNRRIEIVVEPNLSDLPGLELPPISQRD